MTSARDHLEIHLFGGFSVLYGGEPVPPLPSRPARLLFAWLALQAGRPQPRATLTDRLWPELPEARARRRLSHALWQVQDGLSERAPDQPYLLTPGDAVVFDASAPYWLDVEEFEARLDTVDRGDELDGPAMRNLRRCVELYHGDLLAGSYESWVLAEQDRLKQRYVNALGRLVEGCKQRGSFDEALQFARRLTHQAPLREDAHREVMRLCVLLGQPSQALEQFERCRSVLAEELGEAPSAATVELCQRIAQTRGTDVARRPAAEDLVSRRLVGRDDERVALVDQLERTLAGSSGMVFVEGEPGVGKSQLLVQAAEDARWRGFTVLWGACAGPDVPYAAVSEALAPELGPVRVAQLRGHVGPVWLQVAGQLLPSLDTGPAARRPAGALDGSQGADRMREALARVLTGFAAVDPVLLVIEDAHRADEETLALLRTLGRGAGAARLLVVVSFRDLDARAEEPVWAGLRAVDREARPVRLGLAPLSVFETAALLREVLGTPQLPADFAERVHREGGGNPLYVLELLRAMRDEGSLTSRSTDRLESRSVPVTGGLRNLIGDRLGSLLPAAGEIVRLGAVLGEEFDLDTLEAAAAAHDGTELPTALSELTRRNVLEVAGDRCRFTHAATRRVVLDALGADEARGLHLAAGKALEVTHPGRVEALATHFREAGAPDRALPYLRSAAERALRLHAYASAVGHLSAAVALGDDVETPAAERFELLALLEGALGTLGRRDEQGRVLDQLTALAGSGGEQEVEALLRRATYLGHVDRFAEAAEVAGRAADRAGAHGGALHGRALTALGRVLGQSGDNEQAADVLARAVELLPGDTRDAVQGRFALGAALRLLQRFDDARSELEQALELAEELDDRAGAVEALGALADLHAETARTPTAIDLYEEAIRQAREIGYRHREGVGLVNLGTVRLSRGEPAASLKAYDEALDVFRSLGHGRGVAMVELNRAWLSHRWLGQDDAAEQDARSALRYFEEVGHRAFAAVCLETVAGIARRRGDLDVAADELGRGLALAKAAGDQRVEVQLLRGQVELAMRSGANAELLPIADRALQLAEQLELTEFTATLAAARGVAALELGDAEGAWWDAEMAVTYLPQSDEPYRVHHHVAVIAADVGRADTARRHRLAAYRQLQQALAPLGEDVREAALRQVPTHRAIVEAGEALSPRTVTRRMARRDAPRGRALERDETVAVRVELGPPPSSPRERRDQLLYLLQQVEEQAARATVEDLSVALDVSTSTVRRDLRQLRSEGYDATTRGSAVG